ncbi:winged helix-turn-helix domain-containing protein [Motilimonas eburnea]|uniref:winged helix-turn-helix domain-containing protein n=1 Tax=Motilimonas eburnea TaxID=1737488 RepID=UPI001E3D0FC2|nr:transcriptional regulator [Motilimonas eburnea]MCE2570212.1 transcriptional regulator [Motilimonas eburnea]
MRFIRCGTFTIDTELARLQEQNQDVQIDPKVFNLLLFFCQNPNKLLSRQDLLDNVWGGSMVTDNAINKIVANLRKTLNDDPKKPSFIQTVPKKGYCFIADVTFCSEQPENEPARHQPKGPRTLVYYFLIGILTLIAIIVGLAKRESTLVIKTKELTRAIGAEHSAIIDPNLRYLLFVKASNKSGKTQLWRKDLSSNKTYRVRNASSTLSDVFAIDSQDHIYYLQQHQQSCSVNKVSWASPTALSKPEVIFNCSQYQIEEIKLAELRQQVFFTAHANSDSDLTLYRYDIVNQQQYEILIPEKEVLNISKLDVAPDEHALLIISTPTDNYSQFFTFDLDTGKTQLRQHFDYPVSEAIWYHDSDKIVMLSEPPEHSILLTDRSGKQQVLVNLSEHYTVDLNRINNGSDVLFTTTNTNFNLRWLTMSMTNHSPNNSSVYDYLPSLAHQQARYAFISKRSGINQVYMSHSFREKTKKLTDFKQHRTIKSLSFSPDDRSLLLVQSKQISSLTIPEDKDKGTSEPVILFSTSGKIGHADWLNNQWLSVRVWQQNHSTNYLINAITGEKRTLSKRWHSVIADHSSTHTLYLIDDENHQLHQVHLDNLNLALSDFEQHPIAQNVVLPANAAEIKISQGELYYLTHSEQGARINVTSLSNHQQRHYDVDNLYGYDVGGSNLIVSEQVSQEGDVHTLLITPTEN